MGRRAVHVSVNNALAVGDGLTFRQRTQGKGKVRQRDEIYLGVGIAV